MTEVDWFETFIFVGLSYLVWRSGRADFFIVFSAMLANHILGRVFIATAGPVESVALCGAFQMAAAIAFALRAAGAAGAAIGLLFGGMAAIAGITLVGHLSPHTSVGPANNYWTIMSTLAFFQDCALFTVFVTKEKIWHFSKAS